MGLLDGITGAGEPPVMLIHGFASSFEHCWRHPGWADLIQEAGRRVVGVDLLGHGEAPKPTDPEAYDDLEEQALAAVGDEPTVDAIGHSMGARVTLVLASRHPERFRQVVVMGVGANLLGEGAGSDAGGAVDGDRLLRAMEGAAEGEGGEGSSGTGDGDGDVLGRLFRGMAEKAGNDPAALATFLKRPHHASLTRDDLARITCPVLVLIGDQDFAGPGEPLAEAIPGAKLVTIPGVDHFRITEDFHAMQAALDFVGAG